jgi:hypothetical protein
MMYAGAEQAFAGGARVEQLELGEQRRIPHVIQHHTVPMGGAK